MIVAVDCTLGVWVGMAAMLWQASLFLSALGGHSTGRWRCSGGKADMTRQHKRANHSSYQSRDGERGEDDDEDGDNDGDDHCHYKSRIKAI